MALFTIFKGKGESGFGYNTTAEEVVENLSLANKNILVTGCTSGLGAETCRVLAAKYAVVFGTARNQNDANRICQALSKPGVGLSCDLGDLQSIMACIATIKSMAIHLDAIICNAGIMALPNLQQINGVEKQFFTNHVGHFVLVTGLLDSLAEGGRVVMLSSSAHKQAPQEGICFDNLSGTQSYHPWKNYGQSKLANLLFAKELQRRFSNSSLTAYAVHPGVIRTNLARHMGFAVNMSLRVASPLFLKTVAQGAATSVFAAIHHKALPYAGEYLADCNPAATRSEANDPEMAARLWTVTENIVAMVKENTSI